MSCARRKPRRSNGAAECGATRHACRPNRTAYVVDGDAWRIGIDPFGITNHATTYQRRPKKMKPGTTDRIIHATRMRVESSPKYSPRPPHTPAIRRSVCDRISPARVDGGAGDSARGIRAHAAR